VLSACLYRDLPVALFALSLSFVAWNKVQTAQYFLWWIVPLLLVTSQSRMGWKGALALLVPWAAAEGHWLFRGFQVEMLGDPAAFRPMWVAGAAFFLANVGLLAAVLRHHRLSPVFHAGKIRPLVPAPRKEGENSARQGDSVESADRAAAVTDSSAAEVAPRSRASKTQR